MFWANRIRHDPKGNGSIKWFIHWLKPEVLSVPVYAVVSLYFYNISFVHVSLWHYIFIELKCFLYLVFTMSLNWFCILIVSDESENDFRYTENWSKVAADGRINKKKLYFLVIEFLVKSLYALSAQILCVLSLYRNIEPVSFVLRYPFRCLSHSIQK